MPENIERNTLDLRYQDYRLRDDAGEARLLSSLAQRGIEEPLEGVDTPAGRLLLNGFKRYRCAEKLHIGTVPYVCLAEEEAAGILQLMRVPTEKGLCILEQARFVVDLLTIHGLSLAEVAETLGRSKGWVSLRSTLLKQISDEVRKILFAGKFSVYCSMDTLRPFRRMNGMTQQEIDRFIQAVAGKRLSVRDIKLLAQGYFRGPDSLREAIGQGKLNWSLEQIKHVPDDVEGCNDLERVLLKDLQAVQKLMQRITTKCHHEQLQSRAFFAQANLLLGSLLCKLKPFGEKMKEFHDRSGHA